MPRKISYNKSLLFMLVVCLIKTIAGMNKEQAMCLGLPAIC